MFDLTGKTFVVTGGSGMLGGEAAGALLSAGANVVVLSRSLDPKQGPINYTSPLWGWQAKAVHGDVMNRASLVEAATTIKAQFGPVYGLVNAAGGNKSTAITSPELTFCDLPEEGLRFVLDLNILGTLLPCQIFGQQMAERGEGVILNYSSMGAYRPITKVAAYCAAKAAIPNFTACLAVHMAQNHSPKIRVNAIAPGFFLSELNRDLLIDRQSGELTERGQLIISHTPMGRLGQRGETVSTVLWLLSPASAFVTGVTVPVDGGFEAYAGV